MNARLKFNQWFDWLLLALLIFVPRLLNLNVFLTPDEPLFLRHARDFAAAVAAGNPAQTLGIGYPGVTVAAWAAPWVNLPATDMGAFAAGRAATALLTGGLLLLLFGLSKKLLGRRPALIGAVLLALDPYSLSYSRLLHIAAPLALLMTLAGVSLLLWLRDERPRWILLAGVFTGLALLTKSTAMLLGPMLAAAALGWGVTSGRAREARWWGRLLLGGLALAGVAAVTFFALWPAMWADPAATLSLTFGKLFNDQQAGTGNLGMFWLGQFVDDPGPAFYPVAFLLKATPWLLAGLVLSVLTIFHSKFKIHKSQFKVSIALWLFALTYLLLMTVASKKSIRYMLPAFPAFYLLTGIAFDRAATWLRQKIPPRYAQFTIHNSQFIIVLLLAGFAFVYHPYYFSYYNPALLGWRWAPQTLLVGWGEGLDGAARYLGAQPEQTVAAWYEWLFPLMYPGPVEAVVPQENMLTADRTVLYLNQVQRDIPGPNIIDYFRTRRRPEHTVRLNGIEYAWVYPGPVAGAANPAPQVPANAQFGGELRLLGYDKPMNNEQLTMTNYQLPINNDQIKNSPNSTNSINSIITLYWQVMAPPPDERFVFVRLLDEQGRVWASADSPPVMGLWPVERWQAGMNIEDAQVLPIPPGTPPGTYRLEVGVYNPQTGQPLPASGLPPGPGGGLLLGDFPLEWRPVTTPPALPHPADARLAHNARLVGFGDLPPAAATGDELTLELAWQESRTLASWWEPPNNFVLFEWRRDGQTVAEQLDALPLPVERWGKNAVLRSLHTVIVPPALTGGPVELTAALHNGSDRAGERFSLGVVDVTAPPHTFDLPAAAQPPDGPARLQTPDNTIVSLAGYTANLPGGSADVTLYWQTGGPLVTGYKVFVQLLTPDGQLAAQSDSIPAGGARPTTGWLPGEIITDAHTLPLPPDLPPGTYRLIAGLYNPATGARLSLADGGGDAISVTGVAISK